MSPFPPPLDDELPVLVVPLLVVPLLVLLPFEPPAPEPPLLHAAATGRTLTIAATLAYFQRVIRMMIRPFGKTAPTTEATPIVPHESHHMR
jgi:hypothetical protein